MKKYYSLARLLHLYFGLFISPFILIFSVSVFVLNHTNYFNTLRPGRDLEPIQARLSNFQLLGSDSLTATSILQQLGIAGEIDWINKTDSTFSFPVHRPGLSQWISVNTKTGIVLMTRRDEGIFKGMTYLHTMPGQHNAKMRGNSVLMKAWRVATDVFVYFVLFASATGVFLWYFLRPERRLGIYSLGFGFVFLIVLLILLF
jgi:hypothetical protein